MRRAYTRPFQVGVARQRLQAFCGEFLPCGAASADNIVVDVDPAERDAASADTARYVAEVWAGYRLVAIVAPPGGSDMSKLTAFGSERCSDSLRDTLPGGSKQSVRLIM